MASKKTAVKSTLNDDQLNQAAALFSLASDKTRLRILQTISAQETNVSSLCEVLGQSQPAVSHHLALLRISHLAEARRQGKQNFYRLAPLGEQVVKAMAALTAA